MSAIKGVGENAIQHIVEQRTAEGGFKSIFDFASRVDVRICNRRTLESLIQAGAFDSVYDNRAQLLHGIEDILSYANRKQEEEKIKSGQFVRWGWIRDRITRAKACQYPKLDLYGATKSRT